MRHCLDVIAMTVNPVLLRADGAGVILKIHFNFAIQKASVPTFLTWPTVIPDCFIVHDLPLIFYPFCTKSHVPNALAFFGYPCTDIALFRKIWPFFNAIEKRLPTIHVDNLSSEFGAFKPQMASVNAIGVNQSLTNAILSQLIVSFRTQFQNALVY